ncbi:PEGA domain-containing protein [Candidatus Microgenomates bacterium]|nr:PEGA domain-containing protein [Candidatus Microgenomates bacterium]
MKNEIKKRFPTTLFIITIFILISLGLIIYARGYRLDFKSKKILGTGLLVATSLPDGASVYLNDHLTTATNTTINLAPGEYKVRIVKDGYLPWQKNLKVREEIVTKTEATLFPSTPELKPLSVNGAINPSLSSDGTKLVFAVKTDEENGLEDKSGLWVIDMLDRPLSFSRLQHQIVKNSPLFDYSKAHYIWSPNAKELIVIFIREEEVTATNTTNQAQKPTLKKPEIDLRSIDSLLPEIQIRNAFLLQTENLNTVPKDITPTLSLTLKEWQEEEEIKTTDQFSTLKPALINLATNSASLVHFAPDESKILYVATSSAQIPQIIKPALIGTNSQPQERDLKPGNLYVYDIKEDKNFRIASANELKFANPQDLSSLVNLQSLFDTQTIRAENITFQWMADSRHLLIVQPDKISLMEYDGTNKSTVYAGPFEDALVFPWPNGTKVVLLTSLNSIVSKNFNLYTLNLK